MFPTEISTPWPVYAGEPESMVLEFKDENGVPQDLTTFYDSYRCQWRKTADNNQAIEVGIDLTDVATGILRLELTAEQTRGMNGPGTFDIEASIEGDARTLLIGRTSWKQDVTR